jgi:nucleoside-diphosphate-sugar epimerase
MDTDMAALFGAIPDRVSDAPQVADIRQTEAALNWRPSWSLDAGLSETIDWFRDQGNVPGHTRQAPREALE